MFYVVKNGGEQILYSTSSASISARRWELLDIIASSPKSQAWRRVRDHP